MSRQARRAPRHRHRRRQRHRAGRGASGCCAKASMCSPSTSTPSRLASRSPAWAARPWRPISPIRRTRERSPTAADGVDYLVNAAGIILIKPIFEVTVEDWRRRPDGQRRVGLLPLPADRAAAATRAARSSTSPRARPSSRPPIEVAAYAASKTTILSITRSFAYALAARPVRVNAICPGIVDTPMQDAVLDEVAAMRGTTGARLERARATRRCRSAAARRAEECAGADLVPAVGRGGLHDRARRSISPAAW